MNQLVMELVLEIAASRIVVSQGNGMRFAVEHLFGEKINY